MSYRSRDQKRDKMIRCKTCRFFKVPPGTFDTVCPDCRAEEIMLKALKKIQSNDKTAR